MILIYYKQNKFNSNYHTKYNLNYKFLLNSGLNLGNTKKEIYFQNTSIIYGLRNDFAILKLQNSIYELKKILKILELTSYRRGVIYFINSYIGFRIIMKTLFSNNNHYFFLKKNKLERFYLISKWFPGFLTNNNIYFNTLKFKIKFPRLPHFGFIGDHNLNFNCLLEFNKILVPTSSLIDSSAKKTINSMYAIISNGKSLESIYFYFFNILNSIYIGHYNELKKFKYYKNKLLIFNSFSYKKKIFFKNFFFITKTIKN